MVLTGVRPHVFPWAGNCAAAEGCEEVKSKNMEDRVCDSNPGRSDVMGLPDLFSEGQKSLGQPIFIFQRWGDL